MTPAQLIELIESDAEAKAYFDEAQDVLCAARCSEIAPKILKTTRLSELGILGLYPNPADGMQVLATIQGIATQNPLFAKVLSFMQPGVPPECLPDFALPNMRSALTTAINLGGLGFSEALASPILRAAETNPIITPIQVEEARTR